MSVEKKCIYCGQVDPSRFRGVEHVIPQSFGTFGSETPTLDCVCDDCNRLFGRELDQFLARETYEGISRYKRGIFSSEARPQKRLRLALADEAETGGYAGAKVAVDGTTGNLMPLAAQFHVFNFSTGTTEIYLKHDVPSLTLPQESYGKPGRDGKKGTWRCKVFAPSKEEHDAMVKALHNAGIDFRPGEPFQMPAATDAEEAEQLSFLVSIEGEVDTQHKRAIAKILMNFVARYLGRDEALKPRWDFLRGYIRHAEGRIRARLSYRPFWTGHEMETRRFKDDSINVRVENLDGNIVGAVQFYNLHTHEMILVESDSLPAEMEIGFRYTPGQLPIQGDKRRLSSMTPARLALMAYGKAWTYPVLGNEDVRVVDRLFSEARDLTKDATTGPDDPPIFANWLGTLCDAASGSEEWEEALFAVADYFGLSTDL